MSFPLIDATGHLLARAWTNLLSALSTSTLSILVSTVALPAITSVIIFVIDVRRARQTETPIKDIVTRSVFNRRTAVAVVPLLVTWIGLFGWSVVRTIYDDHITLVRRADSAEYQLRDAKVQRELQRQQLLGRDARIEAQSRRIEDLQDRNRAEESGLQPRTLVGLYEWQWAGDGWIGRVDLSKNADGHLEGVMRMMKYCGGQLLPFMEAKGPANSDRNGLRMELAARVSNYDAQCKVDHTSTPHLSAILQPVAAYAGTVKYLEGKPESPPGDMVLVRYESKRHIY